MRSSRGAWSAMPRPEPLARFLLEKAEQIEAERQRKKWLHEMAVEEAMNELIAYTKLIKEAKAFLDKYAIEAHLSILKSCALGSTRTHTTWRVRRGATVSS